MRAVTRFYDTLNKTLLSWLRISLKAAVVMSGRTLEGTCQDQGIIERGLHQSLAKMRELGLIDGRLWEWAQLLKTVRNAAAHFNDEPLTRQDAEDCLAFNEALLDYLYVLTKRFNAMKQRRQPDADQA